MTKKQSLLGKVIGYMQDDLDGRRSDSLDINDAEYVREVFERAIHVLSAPSDKPNSETTTGEPKR